MSSTADSVLAMLGQYRLTDKGNGRYECDSPLRTGSDSLAFSLLISGPERGTYYDHVSGDKGSLYTLATALGIGVPTGKAPTKPVIVATYSYVDITGTMLYQSCRLEPGKGKEADGTPKKKSFFQRRPDGLGGWITQMKGAVYVLYRLPSVRAAIEAGGTIYIVEGEKDADLLTLYGRTATTNVAGAGKWRAEYTKSLTGATVVILPDNDQPGIEHAATVAQALYGSVATIKIVNLPGLPIKCDVSDWIESGHTLTELDELVQATPEYMPPTASPMPDIDTATGGPVQSLAEALECKGYRYSYETETQTYWLNGRERSDHDDGMILAQVIDEHMGNPSHFELAVKVIADKHKFARIEDTLRNLVWDGGDHIGRLADCLKTRSGDVIHYQDGTTKRAALAFLARWLVGAVGKVFDADENLVLVLAGAQDKGKSYFARWLGSVVPGTHYEGTFSPEDKDTALRMLKTFVWELAELDGITSKHASASMKMLITLRTVTTRRAYGRNDTTGNVKASFIGSVNPNSGDGFLSDPTGNRRYMVVSLTDLDWSYTRIDVNQIWAQAVALYLSGERGRPCDEERMYRDTVNAERYERKGMMFDFVHEYFYRQPGALISNTDVWAILQSHRSQLRLDVRSTQMEIASALQHIGGTKVPSLITNGKRSRGWKDIAERLESVKARTTAEGFLIGPRPGGMPLSTRVEDEDDGFLLHGKGDQPRGRSQVDHKVDPDRPNALNGTCDQRDQPIPKLLKKVESPCTGLPLFTKVSEEVDHVDHEPLFSALGRSGSTCDQPREQPREVDHLYRVENRAVNGPPRWVVVSPDGKVTTEHTTEAEAQAMAQAEAQAQRAATARAARIAQQTGN